MKPSEWTAFGIWSIATVVGIPLAYILGVYFPNLGLEVPAFSIISVFSAKMLLNKLHKDLKVDDLASHWSTSKAEKILGVSKTREEICDSNSNLKSFKAKAFHDDTKPFIEENKPSSVFSLLTIAIVGIIGVIIKASPTFIGGYDEGTDGISVSVGFIQMISLVPVLVLLYNLWGPAIFLAKRNAKLLL